MQGTQPPAAPSPADPGFKLPEESASPQDTLPRTAPDTAGRPVEVVPGTQDMPPATDTSTRDLAIGAVVFVILLVVYFFVRRVAPSSAGTAGWLLFIGLGFLSAAAVLAIINASRYLSFGVMGPLVIVGVVALVAALFTGRR